VSLEVEILVSWPYDDLSLGSKLVASNKFVYKVFVGCD